MWQELKRKYSLASIYEKLMFINLGIFALIALINTLTFLITENQVQFFRDYFSLPANLSELVFKPWTLITYFFVHFGFWHVLWNMVALYFFGRIFLTFFTGKQFLNYYMLGGLFAGLVFVLSYNIFPALIRVDAILVGASASVFAILFGVTAKAPNYVFNLFNIIKIPLWVISGLYTIQFIFSIPYANAGGELAHLGGAFIGYYYTKRLEKGNDIGKGFEKLMDTVTGWFSFTKKSSLKTVHKRKSKVAGYTKDEFKEFNNQKKVDLILDKISKSGYESLTAEEKEFLFKAGK